VTFFDDEGKSRHQLEAKIDLLWRRASISSPFWGGKVSFLTTRPFLVTNLRWKLLYFGDETQSRHQFWARDACFWRRDPFSSPILGENCLFLTTRPVLVTNFGWELLVFDDETYSRHQFEVKTACFWRRGRISSPFWGGKVSFLTTRPVLVTILGWELLVFDDETRSRHQFWVRTACFWRRD